MSTRHNSVRQYTLGEFAMEQERLHREMLREHLREEKLNSLKLKVKIIQDFDSCLIYLNKQCQGYMGSMCVFQRKPFPFYHSIFNWNNGFFNLFILLKTYFCSILLSAAVALVDVYLKVLYREVVVYSLFSTERKTKAEGGGS